MGTKPRLCILLMLILFTIIGYSRNRTLVQTNGSTVITPFAQITSEIPTRPIPHPVMTEPERTRASPLVTPTQKYDILNTPELTPTHAGDIAIPPDTMIAMENLGGDIYLVNASDGAVSSLFKEPFWSKFVKWQDEGCSMIVSARGGDLLLVDLSGSIVREVVKHQELESQGLDPYGYFDVFLSSDNNWFWFWQASGRIYDEMGPGSRIEFQDIQVVSRNLKQGPFQITNNSGGWVAEWSPDATMIAFSDYDENHVLQTYVSKREGENKTQLTSFFQPSNFESPGADIHQIHWSPDGKSLAINYSDFVEGKQESAALIVDVVNFKTKRRFLDADVLWWIDNDKVVAWTTGTSRIADIYVIDIQDNQVIGRISSADYPQLHLVSIHPFMTPDLIGFFSHLATSESYDFFVYDYKSGNVDHLPLVEKVVDFSGWVATPPEFPGVRRCETGSRASEN